jgi:hypothetical protein
VICDAAFAESVLRIPSLGRIGTGHAGSIYYLPHIRRLPNDNPLHRWIVETPVYTMICYGIRHARACAKSLTENGLQAQIKPPLMAGVYD